MAEKTVKAVSREMPLRKKAPAAVATGEKGPGEAAPLAPPEASDVVAEEVLASGEAAEPGPQYIKLDANGDSLPNDSQTWVCIRDSRTGLVWEVKTDDGGLQDRNSLFSWYQPTMPGVMQGVAGKGRCSGRIKCDTHAYVQAINGKNYCGFSNWRLPTREEMLSVARFAQKGKVGRMALDNSYFPQALASWYWTATSNDDYPDYAWYVLFRNGIVLSDRKGRAKHLRLVRSDKSA